MEVEEAEVREVVVVAVDIVADQHGLTSLMDIPEAMTEEGMGRLLEQSTDW